MKRITLFGLCIFSFMANVHAAEPDATTGASATASNAKIIEQPIVIDAEKRAQTLEGWGVSLCWWANMTGRWTDDRIDTLVHWLTSPNGLNYNIFRYNIPGGDDPNWAHCEPHHMGKGKGLRAEMPGFKVHPDSAYDWAADSAQIKVLRRIREARPDAIFEAFSNSAPWWMTVSGCVGGHDDPNKDNLAPERYADFAQYLLDVCRYFRDSLAIEFRTLEPFNEPYTNYWNRSGSQEGCHFEAESQVEMLKVLHPMLQASGLKTVISASDETSTKASLRDLKIYGDATRFLGQWNVHTYHAKNEERAEIHRIAQEKGLRLWMSESGDGGRGIGGNIRMLQRLFDDMRYLQPVAWVDWQYVEEFTDQWNLVRGRWSEQSFEKVPNFFVRQQVTRFIRQGYTFLQVADEQTLAAISLDGTEIVIVRLNNERNDVAATYDLGALANRLPDSVATYTTSATQQLEPGSIPVSANALRLNLKPRSVVTCVVKLK